MAFELREHTADIAVEATGVDLSAAFGSVANGLAAASCDDVAESAAGSADEGSVGADPVLPEIGGDTFEVSVTAESPEALLFDYLDQLIYERDVRSVLPVDNRVRIERPGGGDADDGTGTATDTDDEAAWALSGTYRGLPLAEIDAREVKAVTYSEMRLERTETGWVAYVVFDV
jgi:SHS2 domain-containing protein